MTTSLGALGTAQFPIRRGDFLEVSGSGVVIVNFPGAQKTVKIRATSQQIGPFPVDGDCSITVGLTPSTFSVSRERETAGDLPVSYDAETASLIAGGQPITVGGDGSGDVVGAAASTNGELPLYNGTSGKSLKRSNSMTGIVKVTDGVVSVAEAGVDYASPGGNSYMPSGW